MERQHVHYFDYLRLMAAVGVVYMHTAAGPLRSGLDAGWHGMNILVSLAFTAVPLFFMMSGYLLFSNERTADISYLLKKRLPHLLIPLAGWTVVAVVWFTTVMEGFSMQRILQGLLASLHTPAWVHFWYMYTMVAMYVISPVLYGGLRSLSRKGHIFVFTLCMLLSLQTILQTILPGEWKAVVNIDLINKLRDVGGTASVFILGFYLGRTQRKIPNWLLLMATAALWLIITLGTWQRSLQAGTYDAAYQNQSSGFEILLAACIFLLFKQNCNRPGKLFRVFPVIPLSLSIYMMHGLSLAMLEAEVAIVTFWDTLWATALNFLLCFVTMKTVATIKPICYLATGMTYDTACSTCNWVYTYRKRKKK